MRSRPRELAQRRLANRRYFEEAPLREHAYTLRIGRTQMSSRAADLAAGESVIEHPASPSDERQEPPQQREYDEEHACGDGNGCRPGAVARSVDHCIKVWLGCCHCNAGLDPYKSDHIQHNRLCGKNTTYQEIMMEAGTVFRTGQRVKPLKLFQILLASSGTLPVVFL